MSLTRTKLVFAMIGCAIAAANGGCTAPWTAPPSEGKNSAGSPALPEIAAATPPNSRAHEGGTESDMAGVLDKLQQVRAIDPAAEQKLLDELRRTPTESWPLVAEQFRASLAYRQQLAAKVQREGEAPAEPHFSERDGSAGASPSPQRVVAMDGRQSAPIGALVDPRSADSDNVSNEAFTLAAPYRVPIPIANQTVQASSAVYTVPAPFAAAGPTYPIAAKTMPTADGSRSGAAPDVQQARFDAGAKSPTVEELTESLATNVSSESKPQETETDWQKLVAKATDDLDRRVVASPATTAEVHQHVSLRILRLLAGDTDKALEPIPHIPPGEQDYWSRQLFALATYLDHHSQPDDKRRAAASVTHLDEAVSHLRELGSLSLRNLAFCKNVYGYGAIEPYGKDLFSPGQQVSLYVEVENYHSQSTEKGFCTQLGSTYELVNEDGDRVGGGEFPDVDDCCRSRRRDFHIQYGLSLPEKLAPGRYQLQVVVKDRQSDKIGNASAAFEIRGQLVN